MALDFTQPEIRNSIVKAMQDAAKEAHPHFLEQLTALLSPSEQLVQQYVDHLGFKEGAWYRPIHNVVVPAAMMTICKREGVSRDLMYAAQLHDAGYALMHMMPTTQGADWQNPDKRRQHMQIGEVMTHTVLHLLLIQGFISLSQERIDELSEIVARHDNPYIGQALETEEEKAHRGADRCFVPSIVSRYKDFMAYASDLKYQAKAAAVGVNIDLKTFLQIRVASFYNPDSSEPKDHPPKRWDTPIGGDFDKRLVSFTESGACEPCYTRTDRDIVESFFVSRAGEINVLERQVADVDAFKRFFTDALQKETNHLLQYARISPEIED